MAFLMHLSMQIKTILIVIITLATLIGIMLRPWKTNEAQIALLGALLLLILGLISVNTAFFTLLNDWNTFFFFLGMMSIAALAEEAGFFDWLAFQAAHYSKNSARRLFFNTFL